MDFLPDWDEISTRIKLMALLVQLVTSAFLGLLVFNGFRVFTKKRVAFFALASFGTFLVLLVGIHIFDFDSFIFR